MADRLGRILDPRPIAPSFDHFPLLNAPAPAPLASTQVQFALCGEHRYHF